MKKFQILLFLAILLLSVGVPTYALDIDSIHSNEYDPYTTCIDKNLGYKIKCSAQWNLSIKPNSIIFLIDEKPGQIVTATISKSTESGLAFSDLTPSAIQNYFSYADSFKLRKTKIGKKRAIRIEANSILYPEVKFLDYLFIRDSHLYRLNFAVNSKEHYDQFESLFEEIVESFDFYNYNSNRFTKKYLLQNIY